MTRIKNYTHSLRLFVRSCGATKAEAEVTVAVVLANGVTIRRAAVTRSVEPASTAQDAVIARCWALRIRHRIRRITPIPIRTPLPNISMHIIKAPTIRLQLSDRMCFCIAIHTIPSHFIQDSSSRICFSTSCPAGIFPFGFCRKSSIKIGLRIDHLYETIAIIP